MKDYKKVQKTWKWFIDTTVYIKDKHTSITDRVGYYSCYGGTKNEKDYYILKLDGIEVTHSSSLSLAIGLTPEMDIKDFNLDKFLRTWKKLIKKEIDEGRLLTGKEAIHEYEKQRIQELEKEIQRLKNN